MANLNITYADMQDSATRMRSNKDEIDARLTECKSIVDNLVAAGFVTDQASGRFNEVNNEFVSSATEMMESLTQLSEWLDAAVTAMQDMDTQLAGSLSQ